MLRILGLRIWKIYLKQDFSSEFEKKGKKHDEQLEIKIAREVVVY